MSRWMEFSDRELKLLYQSLVDRNARTAEKLVDEMIIEAESRGDYRARHIIVEAEPDESRAEAGSPS